MGVLHNYLIVNMIGYMRPNKPLFKLSNSVLSTVKQVLRTQYSELCVRINPHFCVMILKIG